MEYTAAQKLDAKRIILREQSLGTKSLRFSPIPEVAEAANAEYAENFDILYGTETEVVLGENSLTLHDTSVDIGEHAKVTNSGARTTEQVIYQGSVTVTDIPGSK